MSAFTEDFYVYSPAEMRKRVPHNKWQTFISVRDTFYSILKSSFSYF